MKYLFVCPKLNRADIIPTPGIPTLIGILEKNGMESEYINLNVEYLRWINTKDIIFYLELLSKFINNKEYQSYPMYFKSAFFKKYDENVLNWLRNNIYILKIYLETPKEEYYNYFFFYYLSFLESFIKHIDFLSCCSDIYFSTTDSEKDFFIDIESFLFLFNSPLNNLQLFYSQKVDEILAKKPDVVGIQILRQSDLLSGLYLAYILKKKDRTVHINIGGYFFESYYRKIKNLKDLFGLFFDSISIGDSTGTVLDIVRYLKKEIHIEDVRNIIFVHDGNLNYNLNCKTENINSLPFQSFKGYRREDYLFPEYILPVRASTTYSCYWGKCIFCTCSGYNEPYKLMSVERFTSEIEYLSKKYGTKFFVFWDNALPPEYMERVADILIQKKLNIKYSCYARFEKNFKYGLLRKMRKSGCMFIHWGLESSSQRVLDYINKGINIEDVGKILKYSKKAGIGNYVTLILGNPTETISEMEENYTFIKKNYRNIDIIEPIGHIWFMGTSIINNNYEYYKKLINYSSEYEQCKSNIIKKIIDKCKITNNYSKMLILYPAIYREKYGKLRFNIMKQLLYYYDSTTNKVLKKFLSNYFKFEIKKTIFHTFKR